MKALKVYDPAGSMAPLWKIQRDPDYKTLIYILAQCLRRMYLQKPFQAGDLHRNIDLPSKWLSVLSAARNDAFQQQSLCDNFFVLALC